jgi:hypothetical protein
LEPERLQRFFIELTGHLQTIPNLIPANRCSEIRIGFTADVAVVEAGVFQSLLYAFNQLIRSTQHH